MWSENEEPEESLKVLDPDDPLMKRFQDALRNHLLKISNKEVNKKREQKGLEMYDIQQAVSRQQTSIEKYKTCLEDSKKSREEKEVRLAELKEIRNKVREEVEKERKEAEEMNREMESTSSLCRRFSEYKDEIFNHLAVAKRMSEKDAKIEREMIRQKQEADYILLNVSEQIWKLEKEIDDLKQQTNIKEEEKLAICQTIADADTDLEALQRERTDLVDAWKSVVNSISQRDEIYNDLSQERMRMQESFKTLQTKLEKLNKDTYKEMENNEKLTAIHMRLEEELASAKTSTTAAKDQLSVLEYKTNEIVRFVNQTELEYTNVSSLHQHFKNKERATEQELDKIKNQKNILENEVLSKLEDRVVQDKTMRSLTKVLREFGESNKQLELSMFQAENQYGKNLLNLERLSNDVAVKKEHLEELINANAQREKEFNDIVSQVEKYNLLIDRKQKQLNELNNKVEELNQSTGGIDVAPEDIKIATLEKNIEEVDLQNREAQRQWLRKESLLVRLTQEQNDTIEEINRLNKQIMIMEQKNLKLEYLLENEKQLEKNIDKRMNNLHQRLLKTNAILAEQKEIKDQLQDKNFFTKDEFTKKLQEEEAELIKLQNNIRNLGEEKCLLEEKLRDAHREFFSWEKKVKLAAETSKMIKEEQNPGGEVATMKSEIHKMEIRLSHLKKAQEKMIKDMEHCVTRREMIIDAALAKDQKNPKGTHNKQVLFEKRMDGRRMKIKQIIKDCKALEKQTTEIQTQKSNFEKDIEENKKLLKKYEEELVEIDKRIVDAELIKHHKLECLVRKQRKMNLLQKVRDGKYKMFYKSETILNEEFEKQKVLNNDLIEIMEQTSRDFPHLKENVRKILLTLQLAQ
ncbi:coiled-coil domain-containing protein 40 [Chelonus insularis]|uniref:coiled-coil domain-containing protein 40 n=1 Tax=Chelonus insularis TaxID=460826 RepID=UPI00158EAAFB|nr:coiled-coil domain-containing protein 40 [Chelonus insularis]